MADVQPVCSLYSAAANDSNSWYYPSNEVDSDTSELEVGTSTGNWGKKHLRNARWVRKGKMVAWGPGMDDWEVRFSQPLEQFE
jgi:hypothetical protein